MKHRIRNNKKKLLKTFIQYGLHLWLIIFVCNVAVVYAVRFFLFASTDTKLENTNNIAQNTTSSTLKPTGTIVVGMSFILPGISSTGGNLKPINPVRDVLINLYDKNLNIYDKKVKPIYSTRTTVNFDDDPNSPTYTQFINPRVDLGAIPKGSYQVVLRTSQTLLSAVKEPGSSSLGGKIYSFSNYNAVTTLPIQTLISGDIYPADNNDSIMDINDYNMLVNCFSNNVDESQCPNASTADFDDNGVVDGIDYNIMLLSFRSLKSLGYPIPVIIVPTSMAASPTVSISNVQKQKIIQKQTKSSGGAGIFIILFIILLILGIIGFILFKLHLLQGLFKRPAEIAQSNESMIEKSGYLKKVSTDSKTNDTWVTLADENGIIPGLYSGGDVTDGFVKVKGTMKIDKNNKQYMLISDIKGEE